MVTSYSKQDLKDVLLDPKSGLIKEPFFVISGERGENIVAVASGKNGFEFNKTFGSLQSLGGSINCVCLFGHGLLLMQRSNNGDVKEVKVVSLRPGRSTEVPSGYSYCLINTGSSFLVVLDTSSPKKEAAPDQYLVEKQGLAYYVVEKKGEISFEKNPHYSFHPQITME